MYRPFAHPGSGSVDLRALIATYARVHSANASYGDGIQDATAHLQAVVQEANTFSKEVYIPDGTYRVTSPIENCGNIRLSGRAKVTAAAPGMAAVFRTHETSRIDGGSILGGIIDANTNAALGVHLRYFLNFRVAAKIQGGNAGAIKLGSAAAPGRSAEAHIVDSWFRNTGNVVPGSRAIIVENSGDHVYSRIEVLNYEGVASTQPGCNGNWNAVHGWAEPSKGAMKVGWEERSNNSHFKDCHADTPTEYGWQVWGYQCTWTGCGTYNNHLASTSTDNVAVGIKFESPNAIGTILGHFFLGGSSGKRLKADIEAADGKYGLIQREGCSNQNVVTVRTLYNHSIGHTIRDSVTAGTGFAADAATPTANLGLSIKTGALDRWKIVSDGGAESGGNTGSGLAIRRYDDAGALLSEPVFISRSSGTIVLKSAVSVTDGNNLVFGGATGSQIGTNATQKLAFYGLPPVVQPGSVPAAATDLASAVALVNRVRDVVLALGLGRTGA